MKPGTRTRLGIGALAVVAGAAWLACDAPDLHIFIAGQYIAKLDCVTPGEAVDVEDGPPTDASCDASCVVPFDSDGSVYVTGACAPFPPGDTVGGNASPLCTQAIAAARRGDLCLDGGPSNPLIDAGADTRAEAAAVDARK